MLQKTPAFLLLICSLLFVCSPVSSTGIPFSGNHTFDNLQELITGVPEDSAYLDEYQKGLNTTPSDSSTAVYLGKAALKAANASEAERQFSYVIQKTPSSDVAWKGLFVSLALQNKYDELYNVTQERIDYAPFHDWVWIERGFAESHKNDFDESLESYKKALAINSRNVYGHYYAAWSYEYLKQNQNAIKSFNKVQALSPEYGGVDGNIGFLYLGMKEYDQALPYLEKALVWYPDWTEARRSQGMILYNQGKKEEALAVFDDAIRLDPQYPNTYLSKAEALKDMGQLDEALVPVETGLTFDQNDTDLLTMKGDILMQLNRYDEAQTIFEKVTEIYTADSDTGNNFINGLYSWWAKGYCMERQGNLEEAKTAYTQALSEIEPYFEKGKQRSGTMWHFKSKILTGLGDDLAAAVAEKKAEELGYTEQYYL